MEQDFRPRLPIACCLLPYPDTFRRNHVTGGLRYAEQQYLEDEDAGAVGDFEAGVGRGAPAFDQRRLPEAGCAGHSLRA